MDVLSFLFTIYFNPSSFVCIYSSSSLSEKLGSNGEIVCYCSLSSSELIYPQKSSSFTFSVFLKDCYPFGLSTHFWSYKNLVLIKNFLWTSSEGYFYNYYDLSLWFGKVLCDYYPVKVWLESNWFATTWALGTLLI